MGGAEAQDDAVQTEPERNARANRAIGSSASSAARHRIVGLQIAGIACKTRYIVHVFH